jgi:hypothetical protein
VALGIAAWVILTCAAAGFIGYSQGFPTLWGERVTPWTYALPLPMTWGMLHLPGLALGIIVLAFAAGRGAGGGRLIAAFGAGLVVAGVIAMWDPERGGLRAGPMSLYPFVDGIGLLLFATWWWRTPSGAPVAGWIAGVMFALPIAVFAIVQGVFLASLSEWRPATSEWNEQANLETLDYFPNRNLKLPRTADEGCKLLARMAPDPYPSHGAPGGWPKRHRILRLYAEAPSVRSGEQRTPLLTYEWWPERNAGQCTSTGFSR